MEMHKTSCPICGSTEDYIVLYKSNFHLSDISHETFSARRLPDLIHYQIVQCKNDSLVRSNPVLGDVSPEVMYKNSKLSYEEQIGDLTVSYLNALNSVLPFLSENAKMLEVGCGNGFILNALFDKGYKNLCGIEPSLDAVSKADQKIKAKITTDILREGLYPNETFDFIFFFQTLDHIQDPISFLRTCYKLLTPGGFILAFNHDVEHFSARLLKEKSPIIDIEHFYLYSRKTIRALFDKCGFDTVNIFSPVSTISLKYFLWLMPFLSKRIKQRILNSKNSLFSLFLKQRMKIKLGNLCIIARKPNHS